MKWMLSMLVVTHFLFITSAALDAHIRGDEPIQAQSRRRSRGNREERDVSECGIQELMLVDVYIYANVYRCVCWCVCVCVCVC